MLSGSVGATVGLSDNERLRVKPDAKREKLFRLPGTVRPQLADDGGR